MDGAIQPLSNRGLLISLPSRRFLELRHAFLPQGKQNPRNVCEGRDLSIWFIQHCKSLFSSFFSPHSLHIFIHPSIHHTVRPSVRSLVCSSFFHSPFFFFLSFFISFLFFSFFSLIPCLRVFPSSFNSLFLTFPSFSFSFFFTSYFLLVKKANAGLAFIFT